MIHGFANGYFGRDSYACRRVEAVGADWIVTRNLNGEVELITRKDAESIRDINDRTHCSQECPA